MMRAAAFAAMLSPMLAHATGDDLATQATSALGDLATTATSILAGGLALLVAFATFKIVKKGISRAS